MVSSIPLPTQQDTGKTLAEWGYSVLANRSDEPRREVQLLLAFATGRPTSHLIAWPDRAVPADQGERFVELVQRRAAGEPMAYLMGRRAFWSLELTITPATLIPRPETEHLVEAALSLLPAHAPGPILDLGSGSGAVALALAAERPGLRIVGVDQSSEALTVARSNAATLGLTVEFLRSNWFSALAGQRFAMIVANPPYVASNDPHMRRGDLRFEPRQALDGGDDGLDALRAIISAAPDYLTPGGALLLEHGFDQGAEVIALLRTAGFIDCLDRADISGQPRVAQARWPESNPASETLKKKEDP